LFPARLGSVLFRAPVASRGAPVASCPRYVLARAPAVCFSCQGAHACALVSLVGSHSGRAPSSPRRRAACSVRDAILSPSPPPPGVSAGSSHGFCVRPAAAARASYTQRWRHCGRADPQLCPLARSASGAESNSRVSFSCRRFCGGQSSSLALSFARAPVLWFPEKKR